jgi:hypothetical protein
MYPVAGILIFIDALAALGSGTGQTFPPVETGILLGVNAIVMVFVSVVIPTWRLG